MNEEKTKFKIPVVILWILTIVCWAILIERLIDWNGRYVSFINPIWLLVCLFVSILVFVADMLFSDIYNKPAWIIMVIIVPYFSFPLYILQKKKLLGMQRKKNNFGSK